MQSKPLISTVITTYKRADMLTRAINSVLNQTYTNNEVIIVDDNNPDTDYRRNTEFIMKDYKEDSRVFYIRHDKNKNGSAARNTGIKYASGSYICFLDDDNYFYPTKLQKQISYLINNPEYKAVYCGWKINDNIVIPYRMGDLTYEQLIGSNIIDTSLIMIEKPIIEKFGGWDERLSRNQDVSFILRYFNLSEKIGVVKEALVFRDLTDRSNVANTKKNEENMECFLRYYEESIKNCEKKYKNARKKIYSSRYRAILLNYLKNRDFKGALKLYLKMMTIVPLMFNKYLFDALVKKASGQPLYSYEL